MRGRLWIAIAVLGSSPAACSSDDDRPTPVGTTGASAGTLHGSAGKVGSNEGGSSASAQGGADLSGGGSEGAGDGNVGHLGGLGPVTGAGGGAEAPALCDIQASWGGPQALSGISTAADERLLSMTHDELSIVFSRDDALLVADRPSFDADFGTPVALTLPAGYTHSYGLALSADGLLLVIVSDTGTGFAEVTRASRQGSFAAVASSERYAALNYDANQFGAYLSSPVLSKDDASLYYVRLTGDASLAYHARGTESFGVPEMSEDMVTLGGIAGDAKLTVSVSADERSLFILDQALGHVAGLWSTAPGAPFTAAANFPGMQSLFTNDGCSRLYGTREEQGALDIVIETPN